MRVLVIDSGNTSSYHALRSISRAGHSGHLLSSEDSPWSRSRYCDRFIRAPDDDALAAFALDTLRRAPYQLVLICGDQELAVLQQHRDELPAEVQCFFPSPDALALAASKSAACRHAESLGLHVPRSFHPTGVDDLPAITERIGLPAVVKGDGGSSGTSVRFACSERELAAAFLELHAHQPGQVSVQEYIPGTGYVAHALFRDGRALALCCHRKDRQYPLGGGVTSAATTVRDEALEAAALRFLESLRWNGLAHLDFERDERDGRFVFLEVDGRVSASIDITRAGGVDQVEMLCRVAAGDPVAPHLDYRAGAHYRWLAPRDILCALGSPVAVGGFLWDFARPGTVSDLDLADLRPIPDALRIAGWKAKHQLGSGDGWRQWRKSERVRRLARSRAPAIRRSAGQ